MAQETTTAEVVAEVPGKIRFGWKQLLNPTPVMIKQIVRVLIAVCTVVVFITQTFSEIPIEVKAKISTFATELIGLVYFVSKAFGVSTNEQAKG